MNLTIYYPTAYCTKNDHRHNWTIFINALLPPIQLRVLMTSLAGFSTLDLTYRVRLWKPCDHMTSHLWRTAAVNQCCYIPSSWSWRSHTPPLMSDIHYRTFSSSYCWQIGPSTGPELRVSCRQMSSRHSRNRTPGILPAFLCLYYRGIRVLLFFTGTVFVNCPESYSRHLNLLLYMRIFTRWKYSKIIRRSPSWVARYPPSPLLPFLTKPQKF